MPLITEKKIIEETGISPYNLALLRKNGEISFFKSSDKYVYFIDEIKEKIRANGNLTMKTLKQEKYRVIDLFAGIGGIRMGVSQAFGNRADFVYSNEYDRFACQTYEANFGENPMGDITKENFENIPDFDLLLAGFPCQPFSIAGRQEGFCDERGNLFFYIADLLKNKKPAAFILENVKNFESHDKGNTFNVIKKVLTEELGYTIYHKVLNSKHFGVPQNRERIFIIGFKNEIPFTFPKPSEKESKLMDVLDNDAPVKYYISQQYLNTLKAHRKRHEEKGNGFGFGVLDPNGVANALVIGGMGRERNMIADKIHTGFYEKEGDDLYLKNQEGLRKLNPRECARLQGFPEDFVIPVSDAQAFKQFGNSVSVPVIKALAEEVLNALDSN